MKRTILPSCSRPLWELGSFLADLRSFTGTPQGSDVTMSASESVEHPKLSRSKRTQEDDAIIGWQLRGATHLPRAP